MSGTHHGATYIWYPLVTPGITKRMAPPFQLTIPSRSLLFPFSPLSFSISFFLFSHSLSLPLLFKKTRVGHFIYTLIYHVLASPCNVYHEYL